MDALHADALLLADVALLKDLATPMRENDSSLLAVGTHVDTYEIVGILGQGGFGITYKVFDPGLGKHFALKEFFPSDLVYREGRSVRISSKGRAESDYQWGRRKFFDEARLLARLNHPNIVKVQRVFEANNTAYMLLDFVPGPTLEKWLAEKGTPTQGELDRITGPLLDALEVVHNNRTCHLDIAPDNILVRATDGAPIVLDFGAARLEIKQRSQLVSAMLFKSGYSAPEQYTSSAERLGPWTDIYAIAATLYRAVAGDRPAEATSRTLRDDLIPASKAGAGRYRATFLRAIDHGLRIPLAQRPQTIAGWRHDLMRPESVARTVILSDEMRANMAGKFNEVTDDLKGGLRTHALPIVEKIGRAFAPVSRGLGRIVDGISGYTSLSRSQTVGAAAILLAALVLPATYLLSGRAQDKPSPLPGPTDPPSPNRDASLDRLLPNLLTEKTPPSNRPGSFVRAAATLAVPLPPQPVGWLGLRASAVTPAMAKTLGLLSAKGVFVQDLAPDGALAAAGGRAGDIIVRAEGRDVSDLAELRRIVQAKQPGESVAFDLWRFEADGQGFKAMLFDLAGRGDAHAMYWAGMYSLGSTLVPRNDTEALAWFRKGGEAGDADAGYRWGSMLADGRGTRKNPWEAQRILLSAGRAGSVDAFVRVAKLLPELRRSATDLKRMPEILKMASDPPNNNTSAAILLGDWNAAGYAGLSRDTSEAFRLYKRAADLGDGSGFTSIGVLHLNGAGVLRDEAEAAEYVRRGAVHGDLYALRILAYLNDNGLGQPQRNPDLAGELMYQAIAAGHEQSYTELQQSASKSSIEFRAAIQKRLRDGGFYTGEANGDFNQPTLAALKALYERRPRVPANM